MAKVSHEAARAADRVVGDGRVSGADRWMRNCLPGSYKCIQFGYQRALSLLGDSDSRPTILFLERGTSGAWLARSFPCAR